MEAHLVGGKGDVVAPGLIALRAGRCFQLGVEDCLIVVLVLGDVVSGKSVADVGWLIVGSKGDAVLGIGLGTQHGAGISHGKEYGLRFHGAVLKLLFIQH